MGSPLRGPPYRVPDRVPGTLDCFYRLLLAQGYSGVVALDAEVLQVPTARLLADSSPTSDQIERTEGVDLRERAWVLPNTSCSLAVCCL